MARSLSCHPEPGGTVTAESFGLPLWLLPGSHPSVSTSTFLSDFSEPGKMETRQTLPSWALSWGLVQAVSCPLGLPVARSLSQ